MQNKGRLWVCLFIIIVLSWLELQFFTEASGVAEFTRQLAHILFLLAIMGVGYYAWANNPLKWLKQVWLLAYAGVFLLILLIGVLNRFINFSIGFLDEIHLVRVFFNSPLPFIMLMVLAYMQRQKQ
jgi:CDP-diglyceride synthetase